MTEPVDHRIAETQLGLFVRYGLRARRAIAGALVLALLAAAAVEMYRRGTRTISYVSESIAIVRPQAAFRNTGQASVISYLANPDNEAYFLPKPLTVVDYALLVMSQSVLESVAAAYNAAHPESKLEAAGLRGFLQPITKLELKTPYEVRYYPTMQLRVQAPNGEVAHELAGIWAEEAGAYCESLTRDVKAKTVEYVQREYDAALKELAGSSDVDRALSIERVSTLSRMLTEAKLALANEVSEFMIASEPSNPTAQGSGWPRYAPIVAFVLVFFGLSAAGMLWAIVTDVRAAVKD